MKGVPDHLIELTDEGRAHLEEHSDSAEDFWSRFHGRAPSSAVMHEVTFLRDAMNDLNRTIGGSLRSAIFASDADTVRKVRLLLERTQNEIRELISQSAGAQPVPGEGQEDSDPDNAQGPDQNPQATQKF